MNCHRKFSSILLSKLSLHEQGLKKINFKDTNRKKTLKLQQ